jgi:hypothetical protein
VGSNPATPTPPNRRSGALIAGLLLCFAPRIDLYNSEVQQRVSSVEARPDRLSASRVVAEDVGAYTSMVTSTCPAIPRSADASESPDEAASC